MTEFRGIGNFDGKKRPGGHAHNEVPRQEEPFDKYGRPLIQVDGVSAQIACRLLCRDGDWPGWFLWEVGSPPPERFRKEAARIAMLMGTGRALPTIFRPIERVAVAKAEPRGKMMTRLPPHACVGGEVTLTACGPTMPDMSITCVARRQFLVDGDGFRFLDEPGCAKKFVLDKHGNRMEV